MTRPTLSDIVVTKELSTAGCLTLWNLSGDVPHAAMEKALLDNDYPKEELPSLAAPETCLGRAVQSLQSKRGANRQIVSPLGNKQWAIRTQKVVTDVNDNNINVDLEEKTEIKVKLNAVGNPETSPKEHSLRDEIVKRYNYQLSVFSHNDISDWLVKQAQKVGAVSVRERGGVYYVPANRVDEWNKIAKTLSDASAGYHKVTRVPAVTNAEVLDLVFRGLDQEVEGKVDEILDEIDSGKMTERKVEHRIEVIKELTARVETFRDMLGSQVDDLGKKLTTLKASLTEVNVVKIELKEKAQAQA